MATEFSTEFDGTNGAAANLTTENPSSATIFALTNRTGANGWFYRTSGDVMSGTSCIECTNDATLTSVWTYSHDSAAVKYYDQGYHVAALPSADTIIGQIRDGGTNKAQIVLTTTGAIQIKNGTTTVDQTAAAFVTAGDFFRWKWGIGVTPGTPSTNQELRLYTDATPANLFGTLPDDTLIGTYNQGNWNQYRLGVMSANALTVRLDRFLVDNSTWPTSGGGGNTAPTANAGADQPSAVGGATISLDGTGSTDPDGTITDYAWTQTAGTTVTLSDDTDPEPTFVAPDTAGTATFQLRVTDDDGAQSAPDTVVITWSNAPTTPTSDFYDILLGVSDDTAATTLNTEADSIDAGFTFEIPGINYPAAGTLKTTGDGTTNIYSHLIGSTVSSYYFSCIFQIDDLSVGPWYLYRALSDTSALRATVRVNTDGSIQQRNGTTAVGTATTHLVTEGEPFRLDWHPNNGSPGTQTARLFTGANLYGTSPVTGASTSGNMDTGTFDRIGIGIAAPAVSATLLQMSTLLGDPSDWPEPFGGATAVPSQLYIMVDGVWVDALIDVL